MFSLFRELPGLRCAQFLIPRAFDGPAELERTQYLQENLAAGDVKLSPEEIAEIRQLAENAEVLKGERYPWGLQKQLFADTPPLA